MLDKARERLQNKRRAARSTVAATPPMQFLMHRGIGPDKTLMVLVLSILFAAAAGTQLQYYLAAAVATVTAAVVDILGRRLRTGRWQFPAGSGITALIVAGIMPPSDLAAVAVVSGGAIALKHLVAPGGRNVFNPAAFGLVLAAMFGGTGLLWWIASTPFVLVLGLALVLWLGLEDVAFSFLAVYAVLMVLTGAGLGALQGRVAFFAFVMVVEPVTSPNRLRSRILYGAGIAALAVALSAAAPSIARLLGTALADTLLVALLGMNVLHRVLPERWMA